MDDGEKVEEEVEEGRKGIHSDALTGVLDACLEVNGEKLLRSLCQARARLSDIENIMYKISLPIPSRYINTRDTSIDSNLSKDSSSMHKRHSDYQSITRQDM